MEEEKPKTITELFWVSIVIKAIGSGVEMLGGIASMLIPSAYISQLALQLTQTYLDGDKDDFITKSLVHLAHTFASTGNMFIGIYFFVRGSIQFLLVVALFKNKLWAYPALLVVLALLVLSQGYDVYFSHSIVTAVITLTDIVTFFLVMREYKIVRSLRRASESSRSDIIIR